MLREKKILVLTIFENGIVSVKAKIDKKKRFRKVEVKMEK